MATVKVTFTLDGATVTRLRDAAERLGRPKSEVVRDAIHDFHERIGRLSERERLRMLAVFDEVVPRIPPRPAAEVEKEIRGIREARRGGGRRSAAARPR
ncbi:MAG: ribbon-helix-helix protein, CopG family [Acidobacteriota bacterium]